MVAGSVQVFQLMTMMFISSFLLYFIDKSKKTDRTSLLLALVASSLIAFLMIVRLDFTVMFLALLIGVAIAGKVDKLPFYAGFILTIIMFLFYGSYDFKDVSDLFRTLTSCSPISCSRPFMFALMIVAFALDEFLHDRFPEKFKSRVLFPFLCLFMFAFGMIEFETFMCYVAFDFGYGIFRFTKIE